MLAPIEELTRALARLPGLGRRSAARASLALLRERVRLLDPLATALATARREITCCRRCGAFTVTDEDPCALCVSPLRDGAIMCVVEDPSDIVSIESSGAFKGRYHVLSGKLSPVHRTGPDKLRIGELLDRLSHEGVNEILLALSTDMEGDATAGYIAELLKSVTVSGAPVKVTRLAFGLPADSGVAYSDPLTLKRAIVHRTDAL